jgi:hypothetical protein
MAGWSLSARNRSRTRSADARVERARTADDQDVVDLLLASGERYTLYADRTNHLPQRIVSKSHVAPLGDVTVTTTFGAFVDAGAGTGRAAGAGTGAGVVKVPNRIITRVDTRSRAARIARRC